MNKVRQMRETIGITLIFLALTACRTGHTLAQDQEAAGIFVPFTDHVNAMATNYIELKDALVNSSKAQAGREASEFWMYLDEMNAPALDAEAEKKWSKRQIKIMGLLERILRAPDLNVQRKAFAALSAEMETLIGQYGPVKQMLYKQYCPKALDGEGASWLNEKKEILNPYEGGLHCGEIVEVIEGKG